MECLVVALFIYVVYTVFIRSRIEAHNCTGHSEPFRNMDGMGHANVEGYGYRNSRR